MSNGPWSLGTLPLDVLTYLVNDCIDDHSSLRALSLTSRFLRNLAFRRICSEKVALNLNLPGYAELRKRDAETDVWTSESYRSISLTKQLFVNINNVEREDHIPAEEYRSLVAGAEQVVGRCPAVEVATVRECTGMNKDDVLDVMNWSSKVLKLPKLRFLFIDPNERRRFRLGPDDQYIARLEDSYSEKRRSKGLECLSVQNCSSRVGDDREYDVFSLQSPFIQKTLRDNINSLNRLWFHGLELQAALKGMPTACLADMRLKSLSIRHLDVQNDLVRVFGLRPRADRQQDGTIVKEDAMTTLQYLYIPTFVYFHGDFELLRHLYTPNLKSLQIDSDMLSRLGHGGRPPTSFCEYFESILSLERFGTTELKTGYRKEYLSLLTYALSSQPNLKTLAVWNSWYAFHRLLDLGNLASKVDHPLERMEVSLESTGGDDGLFQALGLMTREQISSSTPIKTFSVGRSFWEKNYFEPSEICTIISTILYVQQKRLHPKTKFTKLSDESQTSPLVETPARKALFDSVSTDPGWFKRFSYRSERRDAVNKYLETLVSSLPLRRQKWIAKVSDWDTRNLKNKESVVTGIYESVVHTLNDGFKRLELEWKANRLGRRWPKDVADYRFVWERTDAGWELLEST
ncbi:hypothetical protein TWF718_003465 [Orbilia javanica]|uniref:Uncharacterized protein n=1 Tax=Orbilia javanica TaxID=47235 RepID=A0AAN8MIR4_9PEZI